MLMLRSEKQGYRYSPCMVRPTTMRITQHIQEQQYYEWTSISRGQSTPMIALSYSAGENDAIIVFRYWLGRSCEIIKFKYGWQVTNLHDVSPDLISDIIRRMPRWAAALSKKRVIRPKDIRHVVRETGLALHNGRVIRGWTPIITDTPYITLVICEGMECYF